MRKLLHVFYYLLLGAAVLLGLLWLMDKTDAVGIEKGPGLRYTIMVMAIAGIVLGRFIQPPKTE
ncbi:MAG: hypothetical protein KBG02_11535 [Haliscomenobacter sp.]|nr:hypothetical protein [Haliscomenobacter sp.]MBK8654750.1 hypothetical protein [Haliscomenobacter sp.]MBP9077485.1 hypothetical protein [Haliscomenobacter sp.]MBP9874184.1 hypothetical protein [Haliscomenobacter sp.]